MTDNTTYLQIDAEGTGSEIDLSGLTTFDVTLGYLTAIDHGTVLDPSLTSLDGVNVYLDGTGTLAVSQWTSLDDGSINISAGNYSPTAATATSSNSFTRLANIDGSGLYVSSGSLTLPDVTSYQSMYDQYTYPPPDIFFYTTGANSTLSLPALSAISGNSSYYYENSSFTIEAVGDSQIELAALTSIDTADQNSPVSVESIGPGSLINLTALTTYDVSSYGYVGSILSATDSGAVDLSSQLTSLDGVMLQLDGTGNLPISQFTGITSGGIDVTSGNYSPTAATANANNSFTNLSNINGSGLYVSGGSLTLPDVTNYQAIGDPSKSSIRLAMFFEATGPNSTLSLPALSSISVNTSYYYNYNPLTIEATGRRSGRARRLDLDRHGGL